MSLEWLDDFGERDFLPPKKSSCGERGLEPSPARVTGRARLRAVDSAADRRNIPQFPTTIPVEAAIRQCEEVKLPAFAARQACGADRSRHGRVHGDHYLRTPPFLALEIDGAAPRLEKPAADCQAESAAGGAR